LTVVEEDYFLGQTLFLSPNQRWQSTDGTS